MQYPAYSFGQSDDATQFFFESIGPKGVIQKIIIFSPTEETDIFNLALGDYDPPTGKIDDKAISDNGDAAKILATIFKVTHHYLSSNPQHFVYFEGNTPARNRLYRIAISRAIAELTDYFAMFGFCHDSWESFGSNRPYEAFLIRRK